MKFNLKTYLAMNAKDAKAYLVNTGKEITKGIVVKTNEYAKDVVPAR